MPDLAPIQTFRVDGNFQRPIPLKGVKEARRYFRTSGKLNVCPSEQCSLVRRFWRSGVLDFFLFFLSGLRVRFFFDSSKG